MTCVCPAVPSRTSRDAAGRSEDLAVPTRGDRGLMSDEGWMTKTARETGAARVRRVATSGRVARYCARRKARQPARRRAAGSRGERSGRASQQRLKAVRLSNTNGHRLAARSVYVEVLAQALLMSGRAYAARQAPGTHADVANNPATTPAAQAFTPPPPSSRTLLSMSVESPRRRLFLADNEALCQNLP
jgi:hypothetical protein